VKALAVTTARRSKALPDVPTLAESGMADFDVSAWFGLAAPAGLPPEVLRRVEAALAAAAREPSVLQEMERRGADVGFVDAAASARFLAADAARWKKVVEFARIKVDG
jgi:tripartite-type tricarboxylate transporter receptor subunit TctC